MRQAAIRPVFYLQVNHRQGSLPPQHSSAVVFPFHPTRPAHIQISISPNLRPLLHSLVPDSLAAGHCGERPSVANRTNAVEHSTRRRCLDVIAANLLDGPAILRITPACALGTVPPQPHSAMSQTYGRGLNLERCYLGLKAICTANGGHAELIMALVPTRIAKSVPTLSSPLLPHTSSATLRDS